MRYQILKEAAGMCLADVATIKTGDPAADFWLVRKGSPNVVGKPTRDFSEEAIGITVTATEVIDPSYLYHAMDYLHSRGVWEGIARGTTRLVNIRVDDVKRIPLG